MDDDRYSTYDAKARFSEVLRKVRGGRTVTVTYHGEPIAEIRPIASPSGTDARIAWLTGRGVIRPARGERDSVRTIVRRKGALRRFLEDRD